MERRYVVEHRRQRKREYHAAAAAAVEAAGVALQVVVAAVAVPAAAEEEQKRPTVAAVLAVPVGLARGARSRNVPPLLVMRASAVAFVINTLAVREATLVDRSSHFHAEDARGRGRGVAASPKIEHQHLRTQHQRDV